MLERFDSDRAELSRELHDVVGSFLVPLKAEVESKKGDQKEQWAKRITAFEAFIQQTSHTIYPDYIFHGNLYKALTKLNEFLSTSETKVDVHVEGNPNLSEEAEHQTFRIALELLTNIIKHDKPQQVVLVAFEDARDLTITITYTSVSQFQDQVVSIDRITMGQGIIKERLKSIKGKIKRIDEGHEHQVKLTIPLKA